MKIVNCWQNVEDERMSTETVVMLKLTSKMEVSPTQWLREIQIFERNILSNCLCCSEIDKTYLDKSPFGYHISTSNCMGEFTRKLSTNTYPGQGRFC